MFQGSSTKMMLVEAKAFACMSEALWLPECSEQICKVRTLTGSGQSFPKIDTLRLPRVTI